MGVQFLEVARGYLPVGLYLRGKLVVHILERCVCGWRMFGWVENSDNEERSYVVRFWRSEWVIERSVIDNVLRFTNTVLSTWLWKIYSFRRSRSKHCRRCQKHWNQHGGRKVYTEGYRCKDLCLQWQPVK
jgi:hypothetical protein